MEEDNQKRFDVKIIRSKAQKKQWQEVFAERTEKSYGPGAGLKAGIRGKRKHEMESDGKCECGSSSHERTMHKDCPMNKKRVITMPANHNALPLDWRTVIEDAAKDADVAHHTAKILVNTNELHNKIPRVGWNLAMSAINQVTYSESSDEESECNERDILVFRIAMASVFKARNKSKSKITKIKSTYDRLSHEIIEKKNERKNIVKENSYTVPSTTVLRTTR